jgi:hypothetical protein
VERSEGDHGVVGYGAGEEGLRGSVTPPFPAGPFSVGIVAAASGSTRFPPWVARLAARPP